MKVSIIIPHYVTGDMTAYSVSKFIERKGRHEIHIIVIDNGGGGIEKVAIHPDVTILEYPKNLLQSQGIALDYALRTHPHLIEDYFITAESDSFPIDERWLDHYEDYVNQGYDIAGSRLKLSGGEYIHPAGTMYRKKNWIEAMECVRSYGYHFYDSGLSSPSCISLMRKEKLEDQVAVDKLARYLPVATGVFHQGMAFGDDSLNSYGSRTMTTESPLILPRQGRSEYRRIMYEPGQWFAYWHVASGKEIKEIPTVVKWMDGRINQNQEYSLMENGFKHLWGITAYADCKDPDPSMAKIIEFKRNQMNSLIS